MSDQCQVLGLTLPRPRSAAHETWCVEHVGELCRSRVDELPGEVGAWLESDGMSVQLVVDGARGHLHVSVDCIR